VRTKSDAMLAGKISLMIQVPGRGSSPRVPVG